MTEHAFVTDHNIRLALKKSKLEAPLGGAKTKTAKNCHSSLGSVLKNLSECPTVQPTLADFSDPISLWNSLNAIGLQYGAVKVSSPVGWKPPFSLNLDTLLLNVREQKLHRLASGADFKFSPTPWSFSTYKKFGEDFKKEREDILFRDTDQNTIDSERTTPSIQEWENAYWKIVENQTEPVCVHYAADIEVSQVGSGFPRLKAGTEPGEESESITVDTNLTSTPEASSQAINDFYALHPWNLLNLPTAKGSLFSAVNRKISGVTSPWLYFGMLFSSFCWHTEDNYFAAVNYQHWGDAKVWYVIPPEDAPTMQKLMMDYNGHRSPCHVLHSLTVQVSPSLLLRNSIRVYRVVQHENEFVLLWPRTFHCGFNIGLNCNEACNIAPPVWLNWGSLAVKAYRHLRTICIPYEEMIYLATANLHRFPCSMTRRRVILALVALIRQDVEHVQALPQHISRLSLIRLHALLVTSALSPQKSNCTTTQPSVDAPFAIEGMKDTTRQNIPLTQLSDEEFLMQIKCLARLPAPDCSNCYASCYQGVLVTLDTLTILCCQCIDVELKKSRQLQRLIYTYRFPRSAQQRLLSIIQEQFLAPDNSYLNNLLDSLYTSLSNTAKDVRQIDLHCDLKESLPEENLSRLIQSILPHK